VGAPRGLEEPRNRVIAAALHREHGHPVGELVAFRPYVRADVRQPHAGFKAHTINFSTMDLQRNVELEFDPERARFDDVAPGWREHPPILAASRPNVKLAFFSYWCDLVKGLGFEHSQQMPLVRNNQGHGIYAFCRPPRLRRHDRKRLRNRVSVSQWQFDMLDDALHSPRARPVRKGFHSYTRP
jgi:hypothetical protein